MSNFRTSLFPWHTRNRARMVPFSGWDMPVQYTSVIEEHKAVRSRVGLFDISHMARVQVRGSDALAHLERIFTNSVAGMKVGQVRYGLVCNEAGGILDDILITRFADRFDLCINAGNRDKILGWMHTHSAGQDVQIRDLTFETTMIAVQGPAAVGLVASLFPEPVADLKYYFALNSTYQGHACVVSRTGYTGEDGFELIVPARRGEELWQECVNRGGLPCGLGARDTLRLEAAMPLYGHELSESIDPIQAGLGWAVKLQKGEFIGRAALQSIEAAPPLRRSLRVGLQLEGKRAAREGSGVLDAQGCSLGTVTSGSYVPWLDRSIAMGYVPAVHAAVGTPLLVDLRGTHVPARVVQLPFYKRDN